MAVDLQLFALLLGLLWLVRRFQSAPTRQLWLGPAVVLGLALGSAWVFNLDPLARRHGALLLCVPMGLGPAMHWLGARTLSVPGPLASSLLLMAAALALAWRDRLALALGPLWLAGRGRHLRLRRNETPANESYALFLIHFPVLLAGNALARRWSALPDWAVLGVGALCFLAVDAAWLASSTRPVERPATGWATAGRHRRRALVGAPLTSLT